MPPHSSMMRGLGAIIEELVGLFVDDGRFAATIGAWLLLVWQVLPRLPVPAPWRAPLLAIGLLVILLESVGRRAAKI